MRRPLVVVTAILLGATACGSGDSSTGGPPGSSPRCEIDLGSLAAEGDGANAAVRRISGAADLVGGPAARGRSGDWILENDRIRVVVQGARDDVGAAPFGGAIIDADVAGRPGGGKDVLGALAPLHSFGRTFRPESAEDFSVIADGADGKAAVLAVSGRDVPARGVSVARAIEAGGDALAVDPEVAPGVNVTQYYILSPGAQRVRLVTAICNPTNAPKVLAVGDVVVPGAAGERFEPTNRHWSTADGIFDAPWIAYQGGDTAYALVPGGEAGRTMVVRQDGIDVTVQGTDSLAAWTRRVDPMIPPAGAVTVAAGGKGSFERSLVVGTSVGDVVQSIFVGRKEELGRVTGTVGGGFDGGAGARILVTDAGGGTVTVLTAGSDRRFDALLPVGRHKMAASLPGMVGPEATVEVTAGAETTAALELPVAGRLELLLTEFTPGSTEDSRPAAGRSVVRCFAETCDLRPDPAHEGRFREVEPLPAEADDVVFVGHSVGKGAVYVDLVPGEYEVIFSNGPEYEVEPLNFATNGRGNRVVVEAGETKSAKAKLARVVTTAGWISADLRVRQGPGAAERIAGLLADGVEVLVSADRDVVRDYATVANQAEAGKRLALLGGAEAGPASFGGIGAFPLVADPALPGNGALSWAGADGTVLAPGAIFDAARQRGALVQLSGTRRAGGLFGALRLDTQTLATRATPESLHVAPPAGAGPSDSRLFSRSFDAMEILDGGDPANFRASLNDWITFLGKGLLVTGTASSGSTGRWAPTAGAPRTWVQVAKDDPSKLDAAAFTDAIRAHQVIAGFGPFLTVTAKSGTSMADVGGTIQSNGGEVEIEVIAQSPTWMKYNRIEVYSYRPEAAASDGVPNDELPVDAVAKQTDGSDARRQVSLLGTVYNVDVDFPLEDGSGFVTRVRNEVHETFRFTPGRDTFYIVVARTVSTRKEGLDPDTESAPASMAPVVFGEPGLELRPATFANPIFVDVDGGGWNPPAAD